jgi:hypothetical protein
MTQAHNIPELIKLWPSRQEFASDIGANVEAVHKWAKSGRIPSRYHFAAVSAAGRRGFDNITADWMLSVHSTTPSGIA